MSVLLQDIRYALRGFAQRPGYTAVLVVTLALGIGANVAIFSVANGVLFRALPFPDPEELVLVWNRLENSNVERSLVSGPDLIDYQENATTFQDFAAAVANPGTLTGEGSGDPCASGRGPTSNLRDDVMAIRDRGIWRLEPSRVSVAGYDARAGSPVLRVARGVGRPILPSGRDWSRWHGDRLPGA